MGLVPDFTEGEGIQRKAFDMLMDLSEMHQLEQIVNQPTRGKNILDLVFTNKAHLFGDCSIDIIKPQSDHHLVNFLMANPTHITEAEQENISGVLLDITSFCFPKGDQEGFKKELLATRGREMMETSSKEGITHLLTVLSGK